MKNASVKANRSSVSLNDQGRLLSPSSSNDTHSNVSYELGLQRHSISLDDLMDGNTGYSRTDDGWHGATEPQIFSHTASDFSDWLSAMYEGVFEAVFGSWLGNYSCPFAFGESGNSTTGNPDLSLSVSISSLCRRFDHLMKGLEKEGENDLHLPPLNQEELTKEYQIDNTLSQAIQAFSAQWLPLTFTTTSQKIRQLPIIQGLWRDLRKSLPRSMNRPCYRSMLSLYLYAMVPVPVGIPEEEEENDTSLIYPEQVRIDFMKIENMIYWAAMTFDTSSSLTLNTTSVLSAGLLGWESEACWRLVKTCTNIFHEQSEDWRANGVLITEETANQIIAAAQAWKLRVWKMGTILKEALREGHGEEAVYHAHTCVADVIQTFNVTYRPLLAACERRLQYLSQYTKIRWSDELMIHHNLAILITIDAVEIASRTDILEELLITRSDTEGCLLNCLKFGLSNYFTIPKNQVGEGNVGPFALVAVDPYPHHVVASVQLLWKRLVQDFNDGKVDQAAYGDMQSTLLQILELLPQTSKSVRKATEQARMALASHN
ncbi:uncharacterized protein N7477_005086 [Penicillium maclennaniae]|uniref:uncharacterized protein n=1 Tax=Penicillium maclennaniae TaxID=1343394 RepID=UPI002540AA8B|nr:uncharacterized protein N7477_005086 [Penicillium maclennaniae]KAJ5675152.1 hypothetical protein N7477_005086 [Penicillium maclennaniae]